jgi:putative membrane protein
MAEKVRDHLANERTFLAWVRTALGLIGLGFVLARMGLFLHELAMVQPGHAAAAPTPGTGAGAGSANVGHEFVVGGLVFLVVGTALSGLSAWMYYRNRRAIEEDRYAPAGASVLALAGVVVLGGLVIAAMAVWRVLATGR